MFGVIESNLRYLRYEYVDLEWLGVDGAICDRLIFNVLEEGVQCRLEMSVFQQGKVVDGQELGFDGKQIGIGKYTEKSQVQEFNFSFTSDDSDVTIFEPYIHHFKRWFNFFEINNLEKKIKHHQSTNFRDICKNRNSRKRIEEIRDYYEKLIQECSKKECENVVSVLKNSGLHIRWITPIAKTIVNAMIRLKISSQLPSEMKECPHMSR